MNLADAGIQTGKAGRADGVVRGDVRVLIGVGGDVCAIVQGICVLAGARGRARVEESVVEIRRAGGFAVPAGAFAVDSAVCGAAVHFACPLEGLGELVFVDFVVVVEEDAVAVGDFDPRAVFVVAAWLELVCVPGEIDVERGDGHFHRVVDHDLDEDVVLVDQAVGRFHDRGRVQPVDVFHLGDERCLTDDRADKIECEGAEVLPVVRHHAPEVHFLAGSDDAFFRDAAIHFDEESLAVAQSGFKLLAKVVDVFAPVQPGVCEAEQVFTDSFHESARKPHVGVEKIVSDYGRRPFGDAVDIIDASWHRQVILK